MSSDAQDSLRAKALAKLQQRAKAQGKGGERPVDPFSPEALLRGANEDDDLYDPYSDYMDQLARSSFEEPSEDPWR